MFIVRLLLTIATVPYLDLTVKARYIVGIIMSDNRSCIYITSFSILSRLRSRLICISITRFTHITHLLPRIDKQRYFVATYTAATKSIDDKFSDEEFFKFNISFTWREISLVVRSTAKSYEYFTESD